MGGGSINPSSNSPGKLNLDGTELYGEDGQTIADITELDGKEILEILDIKKEFPKEPKIKIR